MDRSDRIVTSQRRKCPVCNQQLAIDHTTTDLAMYIKETGNLMMSSQQTCIRCKEEMVKIRKHVDEESLCFGKDSQMFKTLIEPLLLEKCPIPSKQSSIYQKYIQNQIKRNKLYHCNHLPQKCRQLIYYSSFSVHQAERHQRIKNTILRIMEGTGLPLNNLTDISILVQCLSCYMNENNVIRVFKAINTLSNDNGDLFQAKEDEPYDPLYSKLYKNTQIIHLMKSISSLLNKWEEFPSIFSQLQTKPETIILSVTKKTKNTSMNGIDCPECERNKVKSMEEIAKLKNNFMMILKEVGKQQDALKEYVHHLEMKFYKEKQQFINKIIKLKDKIALLEEGQTIMRPRSASDSNIAERMELRYKKLTSSMIREVSEKSQSTIKIEENGQTNETQESRKYQQFNLHKIYTSLPSFDPSYLQESVSQDKLIFQLEKGVQKMKQQLLMLEKKSKTFENQAKRVLDILVRKQQTFIPMIHQKDILIEKYQNTLWRMENNLPIQDEVLKPRIEAIVASLYTEITQKHTQKVDLQKSTQVKKKKKREQKKEKRKQQEKQCSIF